MVYESTADGFVSENALAGAIPTEIGLLAQLVRLDLSYNKLTGASKKLTSLQFWYTSIPRTKKDLLAVQATSPRNSASARH